MHKMYPTVNLDAETETRGSHFLVSQRASVKKDIVAVIHLSEKSSSGEYSL